MDLENTTLVGYFWQGSCLGSEQSFTITKNADYYMLVNHNSLEKGMQA